MLLYHTATPLSYQSSHTYPLNTQLNNHLYNLTLANSRKNAKTTLHPTHIRIHNSNSIDPNKPYMVIHVGPPKTGTTNLQGASIKLSANGVFAMDWYVCIRKWCCEKDNNPFIWDAMAGKCQRQLLDFRKAHQLEPTSNNNKNNSNKPTSSFSGGETTAISPCCFW